MNKVDTATDSRYQQALATVQRAVEKLKGCRPEEKEKLREDLAQLREMEQKLTQGRVEIVLFGEISTGKSALINALAGDTIAEVDVRGGWTKEVRGVPWKETDYVIPGLDGSHLVLVDTPGINEVGHLGHETIARHAARRGDLILFVTDSDLDETEFSAIVALASIHKPILFVLNKIDLYTPEDLEQLVTQLRDHRLRGIIAPENFVLTSADPREVEYVTQTASGREIVEWRKPEPNVEDLKARIIEVLEQDGIALIALNAAMYAADKTDRVARLRVQLRDKQANQTIGSFAAAKAIAVAVNPVPIADVLGGSAVDATMVVTLAHIYGLEMSWVHAQGLARSILKAAGWILVAELATHVVSDLFKTATLGAGTVLTAIPQGAAAGYGSYIVGQAAKYYFEHGASWGGEAPKTIVRRILDQTDRQSVLADLKEEIKKKLVRNWYAEE
jgi:small GTP-binding protein